jgi:O-antigen/teichoic acid export membrane protein
VLQGLNDRARLSALFSQVSVITDHQDTRSSQGLDRLAIFLSGLCLLHCLAIPVALLAAPLLGRWLDHTETSVHWALLAGAIPLSAVALWRGYRRHHRNYILVLGAVGLFLMLVAVTHLFGPDAEIVFTVVGVSLLLLAHVRNLMAQHQH